MAVPDALVERHVPPGGVEQNGGNELREVRSPFPPVKSIATGVRGSRIYWNSVLYFLTREGVQHNAE